MSTSWEKEFGDYNDLETILNGAQNGTEKFYDDWNHPYQPVIIVVYHNMQNEQVKFELDPPMLDTKN